MNKISVLYIAAIISIGCQNEFRGRTGPLSPYQQEDYLISFGKKWQEKYGNNSLVQVKELIDKSINKRDDGIIEIDADLIGMIRISGEADLAQCRAILSEISDKTDFKETERIIKKSNEHINIDVYFSLYPNIKQSHISLTPACFQDSFETYWTWEAAFFFESGPYFRTIDSFFGEWYNERYILPL